MFIGMHKNKKVRTFTNPWVLECVLLIACNAPLIPKPKCPGKKLYKGGEPKFVRISVCGKIRRTEGNEIYG